MSFRWGRGAHLARQGLGALAATLLQGCAHVYVDPDGARHIVGLVRLTLPPADAQGGEALRSQSIGLSLTRSEAGSALVLGYSDSTLAFVRNHSLVPERALLLDKPSTEEKTDDTDRPPAPASAR